MLKLLSYLMFLIGGGSLFLGIYYTAKLSAGAGGLAGILPLFILIAFSLMGVLFFAGIGLVLFFLSKRKRL